MSNEQGRYWCFTINNYSPEEEYTLQALSTSSYIVYGREVGEQGIPHLQGYVEFPKRLRRAQVSRHLGGRAHVERRSSETAAPAANYCKKDGDFYERGEISTPAQGKRTDLAALAQLVVDGASNLELFEANPTQWIIHRRGLDDARALFTPARQREDLKVFVVWGPSGYGKSRIVRLLAPDVWSLPNVDLTWFDGYQNQSDVIIDDYDGRQSNSRDFLRYTDIYAVQVPRKGGFVAWNPNVIWITSNLDPSMWHPMEHLAVRRRLTKVVKLTDPIDFSNPSHIDHMRNQFS